MQKVVKVLIEDRAYTVVKMNPLEGMEFGFKVAKIVAPSLGGLLEATKEGGDPAKVGAAISVLLGDANITPLFKEVFACCFTPENKALADPVVFNDWFQRYPGDMYYLGVQGVWQLAKDFFPPTLATLASGLTTQLNQPKATE